VNPSAGWPGCPSTMVRRRLTELADGLASRDDVPGWHKAKDAVLAVPSVPVAARSWAYTVLYEGSIQGDRAISSRLLERGADGIRRQFLSPVTEIDRRSPGTSNSSGLMTKSCGIAANGTVGVLCRISPLTGPGEAEVGVLSGQTRRCIRFGVGRRRVLHERSQKKERIEARGTPRKQFCVRRLVCFKGKSK